MTTAKKSAHDGRRRFLQRAGALSAFGLASRLDLEGDDRIVAIVAAEGRVVISSSAMR